MLFLFLGTAAGYFGGFFSVTVVAHMQPSLFVGYLLLNLSISIAFALSYVVVVGILLEGVILRGGLWRALSWRESPFYGGPMQFLGFMLSLTVANALGYLVAIPWHGLIGLANASMALAGVLGLWIGIQLSRRIFKKYMVS
jgi:hypothetical protein